MEVCNWQLILIHFYYLLKLIVLLEYFKFTPVDFFYLKLLWCSGFSCKLFILQAWLNLIIFMHYYSEIFIRLHQTQYGNSLKLLVVLQFQKLWIVFSCSKDAMVLHFLSTCISGAPCSADFEGARRTFAYHFFGYIKATLWLRVHEIYYFVFSMHSWCRKQAHEPQ